MSGEIFFKPIEANLNINKELTGKIIPYVKIKLGKKTIVTSAYMEGGTNPKWDAKLLLRRYDEDLITVELWNMRKILKNELIGSFTVPVDVIFTEEYLYKEHKNWFDLKKKDKLAGELYLELMFVPDIIYPTVTKRSLKHINFDLPSAMENPAFGSTVNISMEKDDKRRIEYSTIDWATSSCMP